MQAFHILLNTFTIMSIFKNSRTVEQFKAEKMCAKINFQYAVKKDENGVNRPLYINDAEGKPTTVQAVTMRDEAGNTLGWCSKAVAEEIAKGQSITARPLSIVDVYSDEGVLLGTKLCHPGEQRTIAGLSL